MLEHRGRRAESLGRDAHREWKRAIVRISPLCPVDDPRRMTLNRMECKLSHSSDFVSGMNQCDGYRINRRPSDSNPPGSLSISKRRVPAALRPASPVNAQETPAGKVPLPRIFLQCLLSLVSRDQSSHQENHTRIVEKPRVHLNHLESMTL